ncbi:MAG: hypothetical protein J0I66_11955 [Microbacterium sp.]|nr:hypothetical protein [Microbacterium sp.]
MRSAPIRDAATLGRLLVELRAEAGLTQRQLAEELDVDLGLNTVDAARAELLRLAPGTDRPAVASVAAGTAATPAAGEALVATWTEVIDAGRMQDGDEHLAATAKPVRARVSAATAAQVGVTDGDALAVSTDRGVLVLPVAVDELPDGVVWVPTNPRGAALRTTLGATHGSVVRLARAEVIAEVEEA